MIIRYGQRTAFRRATIAEWKCELAGGVKLVNFHERVSAQYVEHLPVAEVQPTAIQPCECYVEQEIVSINQNKVPDRVRILQDGRSDGAWLWVSLRFVDDVKGNW
jgi:hypothetical protein